MKKSILFLTLIILIISCKKEANQIQKEEVLVDVPASAKHLIFNNSLRANHGITIVDSLEFIGHYRESDNRIFYEKQSINQDEMNKLFKIEFTINTKDSLMLDSYLIGKDSVLRMQSRIKNGNYVKETYAILFTNNKKKFLLLDETMKIAKSKKIYSDNDSIFYGYEIPR